MPEFPIGLDFITSIWTDHPYYKAEGKKYFQGGGWQQLWDYNATDSLILQEAHPEQMKEIISKGNEATYERQLKVIEPLAYMMERGTRCDMEGINRAYDEHGVIIERLKEELNELAGRALNANSPKQLKEYFYGRLGHKAYLKGGKSHN